MPPNYHVRAGSVYTTTQSLEDKRQRELGYNGGGGGGGSGSSAPVIGSGAIVATTAGMSTEDLLQTFGEKAQVGLIAL